MKPHHILHVFGTAQSEATAHARIVEPLARGLDPMAYKVDAWFLGESGPLVAELRQCCASVRVVNWRGGMRDPVGAWRFWRSLRQEQFAVIHQHFGGRSVRWLARRAGPARVIVHLHGRVSELDSTTVSPIRIQDADAVIAISNAVAKQVVGLQPYVVYPGVHMKKDAKYDSAASSTGVGQIVGTACRLVPIKGVSCLVRAVALLRDDFPNVRLEIAGSGPEQKALECEVESLGLERHVEFLGWQQNLLLALDRWDVFVMPSLEEGFGIAALEAMAVGLPVVATAVGGIPELVENGRTGWLVPPGNPLALADRLRELLLHAEQRAAMGRAGLARARQHFSSEGMVEAISKIYNTLLDPVSTRNER